MKKTSRMLPALVSGLLLTALFASCKSTATNSTTTTNNSAALGSNKNAMPPGMGTSTTPAAASSEMHSPGDGSPERKAILDALAAELKRKDDFDNAVFDVESIKVHDGWAYVVADVDDRESTPYGLVEALAREGNGRWKVSEVFEAPGGGAREERDARMKFRAKYADAPDDIFPPVR